MQNWLIRFLLSLSLAFFFLQGRSGETAASHQQSIIFTQPQPTHLQESVIAVKIEAQNKEAQSGKIIISHKKGHSVQKLLFADGDDDDDNDESSSSKKYITDNRFFSSYFISKNSLAEIQKQLPFCHHFSHLSSNKHLLLCTLRI